MSRRDDILYIYQSEWELLQKKWGDAQRIWQDDIAIRFEKEFWVHWKNIVPEYENAMRSLLDTLESAIEETKSDSSY